MSKLSISLFCIQMRSGVEIWVEKERAGKLQLILEKIQQSTFVAFDDRTINTADVVGVFTAQDMEEHTRRKNGEWKCKKGEWHERNVKCECSTNERTYFSDEHYEKLSQEHEELRKKLAM